MLVEAGWGRAYFYASSYISQNPMEQMPPSVLAALANGFDQREREPSEPTHKIGVDFKVRCFSLPLVAVVLEISFTRYTRGIQLSAIQSLNHPVLMANIPEIPEVPLLQ